MKFTITILVFSFALAAYSQGVVSAENPIIIKKNGAYEPRQSIDNDEKLRMTGSTSDYIISVQDGSGRVQHYWNSTASSGKYLVSSEPAGKILFSPHSSSSFFNLYYAPSGTAGNTISWNNVFQVYTDGRVGIGGIGVPSGFKLAVAGKIIADEIKVEASPWPDYVFSPTYDLRSLEETEAFIIENNHLPEMPSAEEVEANGIQLGEMNALLLKKIEELTLYQIEMMKIIQNQQKEIEILKGK